MAVNVISRTDAVADLPPSAASKIISGVVEESAALRLFQRLPMNRKQDRIRVESALPVAYWVDGDTGMKQTSKMAWKDKLITAEEIAVIVPVPENVIADADYDLWGAVTPRAQEAIARKLDEAIFFGVDKPASFANALVPDAVAAGNTVALGSNAQAEGGIVEDFNDLYATVEEDGFDVNGVAANRKLRRYIRGARNAQGDRFAEVGANGGTIDGTTLVYAMRGQWPTGGATGTANAVAIAGDYTQGIIGVRQDITAKMLDQAVIQDPATGEIAYNLAQQDMVALRLVARFGFVVSNTLTREQANEAARYPFGVLTEAAA